MLKSKIVALTAAVSLSVSAFAVDTINGAGASFPAPLYQAWAHAYNATTGAQINYQSIGSGGGIKQIQKRTVDFGATDAPLNPEQLAKDGLLQFPAVVGSIDIVYNIPGVADGKLKLSNEAAAGIFLGTIKEWNNPIIAKDNPGVKLPSKPITVVYRADGSGTTWNFTYWLDKISEVWKSKVGVGTSVKWPTGMGGKGNEGVSNNVKQIPYSVGYVEYAYAKQNKLTSAVLQSAEKTWVEASVESAKEAAKNAKWTKKDHFYEILALEPGKKSYPLVAATFILLPKEKPVDSKKVTNFYKFAYDKGDKEAEKLGYIPLPVETTKLIESYWAENIK